MDYDYTRDRIRLLFEQTHLTQKDFAVACGLTQSTVTRLLSGKRSPQLATLVKICDAYQLAPDYFVRELEGKEPGSVPNISDPLATYSQVARTIVQELGELDSESLADVLDFVRFRKKQSKKRRAS